MVQRATANDIRPKTARRRAITTFRDSRRDVRPQITTHGIGMEQTGSPPAVHFVVVGDSAVAGVLMAA
jgi:hypothetical protein